MDRFLAALPSTDDGDLVLCLEDGAAYQKDQEQLAEYDRAYFDKYVGYEGQKVSGQINAGRISFVKRHYGDGLVLDIGIGSGEFIKKRGHTYGLDVNPVAVRWLLARNLWADDIETFHAFTAWDVIEHIPTPGDYFGRMRAGAFLFTSIPIFADLKRIRESKHYRPGEHLMYFTDQGFIAWMAQHGFRFLECHDFETRAGRDSILSFAFRKE